jgi:hypothetical protein
VTSDAAATFEPKGVWRIDSGAHPVLLAQIGTPHLEGVITLTNDVARWGPWAGKIITGDEQAAPVPLIFTVDTNGAVGRYDTTQLFPAGIHPEDFDVILPNQDLYACDPDAGQILKLSSTLLTNYVGDLVVTDAGEVVVPAKLFIVHWDGARAQFVTRSIPYFRSNGSFGHFEHVTFAPLNLPPLQ